MKLPVYTPNAPTGARMRDVSAPIGIGVSNLQRVVSQSASRNQANQQMTNVLMDIMHKESKLEVNKAAGNVDKDLREFERRHAGKLFFEPDEIDPDIEIRRTEPNYNPDSGEYEEVPRQIPRSEVYSAMMQNQLRKSIEANKEGISLPGYRNEWVADAEAKADVIYTRAHIEDMNNRTKERRATVYSDFEQALVDQNYESAGAAIDAYEGTIEEKQNMVAKLAHTREKDIYNNMLTSDAQDDKTLTQVEEAIDFLRAEDSTSRLAPNERKAMVEALTRHADRNYMSRGNQDTREDAIAVSDIEQRIRADDPDVTEDTLLDMFNSNVIKNGQTYNRLRVLLNATREGKRRKVQANIELDYYIANGLGIDPKNKVLRDAANERYNEHAAQVFGDTFTGTPQDYALLGEELDRFNLEFMSTYRIAPDHLIGYVRAANRADSPYLADAVMKYQQALNYAPTSLDDLSDSEIGYVKDAAAYMETGMPIDGALAAVREWDQVPSHEKKLIESARQTKEYEDALATSLVDMVKNDTSEYRSGFGNKYFSWTGLVESSPGDIPASMVAEFEAMTHAYLPRMGFNAKAAQRRAYSDIKQMYKVTDINGDAEFMKNPPAIDRSTLLADLYSNYVEEEKGVDYRIQSDATTEIQRRAGKPLTYRLLRRDAEGEVSLVTRRWEYDSERVNAANRAAIDAKARAERERVRKKIERQKKSIYSNVGW